MRRILWIMALSLIAAGWVSGATLDVFTDVSESYAGQPVNLTIRIVSGEQVSRPVLPFINGFEIREAGEARYEERSMGSGGNTRRITMDYSWRLIPVMTGRFEIPSLSITIGKDTLTSGTIILNIKDPGEIEGYHLFLSSESSSAFPGIPVRINLKWLFSSEVSRPEFLLPFYQNSRIKVRDLPAPSSHTSDIYQFSVDGHTIYAVQSAEVYEGKQYASLSVSWDVLAEDSGSLSLSPVLLSFQRGVLDSLGRKSYENAVIPSNGLNINVLPLPDKLKNFTGGILVADTKLQVSASLDQNRIYPGDPLELTLRFQGLNSPELTDFRGIGGFGEIAGIVRADSAELSSELSGQDKIIRQKIRFLSSNPGEFPRIEFPYFNMDTGTVDTCYSNPVQVSVEKLEDSSSDRPSLFNEEPPEETVHPGKGIEIMGNAEASGERFISVLLESIYPFRVPAALILIFLGLLTLTAPGIRMIIFKTEKKESSIFKDLQISLRKYEVDRTRDTGHKIYDQFWKWIMSISSGHDHRNKYEILNGYEKFLSPELYGELQSLAEFLESFWRSDSEVLWKSGYPQLPEKIMKELKKAGNKS